MHSCDSNLSVEEVPDAKHLKLLFMCSPPAYSAVQFEGYHRHREITRNQKYHCCVEKITYFFPRSNREHTYRAKIYFSFLNFTEEMAAFCGKFVFVAVVSMNTVQAR